MIKEHQHHIGLKISLVRDSGFMCGGLQPPLAVGASQVCQGASLLKPSVHTHLDVTVDVPVCESTLIITK